MTVGINPVGNSPVGIDLIYDFPQSHECGFSIVSHPEIHNCDLEIYENRKIHECGLIIADKLAEIHPCGLAIVQFLPQSHQCGLKIVGSGNSGVIDVKNGMRIY